MRSRPSPLLLLPLLLLAGCADDDVPPPGGGAGEYRATIRRTSEGIPHVLAPDLASAAFGMGYAGAQDFVCTLADQIVKVRSERAKTFGDAKDNIDSDFAYLALEVMARGKEALAGQSEEIRETVAGYAAGYNRYLETVGPAGLPAPCTGASWVRPITAEDLAAYYVDLDERGSSVPFLAYVAGAGAPGAGAPSAPASAIALPDVGRSELGSTGWASGAARTEAGRGMLLANPHFPWEGELRFHESHLTVPGELDVYGASLQGAPVINIGFNEHVAWTHTVTPSKHFTVYRLELVPGDPTSYVFDGEPRAMTATEHTIEVLGEDGTLTPLTRTYYRSHYGPMLKGPGVAWDDQKAFTFRDANADNAGFLAQWARMNRATSAADLLEAQREVHGIPWVYTIATDETGAALLVDASRVPALSEETLAAYEDALAGDPEAKLLATNGVILLDGSTSRDDWSTAGSEDGLVPVGDAPQLSRQDFVMNANDPSWLTNPFAPITGYPLTYGAYRTAPSPRTRMNLTTLLETGPGSPSGDDGLFSLDELQAAALSNRAIVAELLREAVVARCTGIPSIDVGGTQVPIADACAALAAWDGRLDVDSKGAVVWRELLSGFTYAELLDAGRLFSQPFDPENPVATPSGLAPAPGVEPDPVLEALGGAMLRLAQAGLDAESTLGEAQFTRKGDEVIPIHGGNAFEGTTNITSFSKSNSTLLPKLEQAPPIGGSKAGLTEEGYLVNFGSSFVMALEFTDAGPRAVALLSYSESSDPASAHYRDQTVMFSEKAWQPVRFTEEEIAADEGLTVEEIAAPR